MRITTAITTAAIWTVLLSMRGWFSALIAARYPPGEPETIRRSLAERHPRSPQNEIGRCRILEEAFPLMRCVRSQFVLSGFYSYRTPCDALDGAGAR